MAQQPEIHRLSIGGMSCAGCVMSVEEALKAVPGVDAATVNFAEHTAQVTGRVEVAALVRAVIDAGYEAAELKSLDSEQTEREARERQEYRTMMLKALAAALVGFPLMAGDWLGLLPMLHMGEGALFWRVTGLITLAVL
ncbi:MAG TPA: cation transporter, partial [Gammaproteobacteria bacterium]